MTFNHICFNRTSYTFTATRGFLYKLSSLKTVDACEYKIRITARFKTKQQPWIGQRWAANRDVIWLYWDLFHYFTVHRTTTYLDFLIFVMYCSTKLLRMLPICRNFKEFIFTSLGNNCKEEHHSSTNIQSDLQKYPEIWNKRTWF